MQNAYSVEETLTSNKFANINRPPENVAQRNNSKKHNSKRTRTLSQEKHPDHSTQRSLENREKLKSRNARSRSATSPRNEQKSRNPVVRCFHWTTQCCRAPQRKKASKRTKDLWKRLKERVKRCGRKKKKTGVADEAGTSTAGYPESSETAHAKRLSLTKDRKRLSETIIDKHGKRTKTREKGTKDGADFADTTSGPATSETYISALVQEKGLPDFTKSCCYMCANAMALIATTDKLHASIQVSDSFKEKFDKSSGPMSYVRTVQSSVKVKMRNVGTHYSEERKSKRPRLKMKNLKETISHKLPKMPKMPNMKAVRKMVTQKNEARKASKPPETRTVACGADTATKHTNTPQRVGKCGAQCVREKK